MISVSQIPHPPPTPTPAFFGARKKLHRPLRPKVTIVARELPDSGPLGLRMGAVIRWGGEWRMKMITEVVTTAKKVAQQG